MPYLSPLASLTALGLAALLVLPALAQTPARYLVRKADAVERPASVQLGPRPFFLVDNMTDGRLKHQLEQCAQRIQHYTPRDFSIGHRGAA